MPRCKFTNMDSQVKLSLNVSEITEGNLVELPDMHAYFKE